MIEEFSDGKIQFAFVKVKDPNTSLPKHVLIGWCGEGVPERTKGYFASHQQAVAKVLQVRAIREPVCKRLTSLRSSRTMCKSVPAPTVT